MRFVVYGAGAVGGVVAARLALAGNDVGVVARGPHLAAIQRSGLRLETPDGSETIELPAADNIADLRTDELCVLLAVKGQDTAGALDDLAANLPPDTTIACLQNGVANERTVLRRFAHVLGICVMLPATHLKPGTVIQSSAPVPGMLDLGCYPSGIDERSALLAEALRGARFESVERPDVMAWKHRKLITNLGNAVQASYAPSAERDRLYELVDEEGERVLEAAGIDVVSRAQDAERRGTILDPSAIGSRGGGSTWQSLARGAGSVEADYLNGEIVLQGRLHGVPTPANELMQTTVSLLADQGAAPSSLDAGEALARLS